MGVSSGRGRLRARSAADAAANHQRADLRRRRADRSCRPSGALAPERWGYATLRAHVGPGSAPVRVKVRNDDAVRPVWTVTGSFAEAKSLIGRHRRQPSRRLGLWRRRPSTGTAAMLELVRVLGTLRREGWSPRRSLLFASWDAEEFGLTSSTEWAEEHAEWLQSRAVAYLNVDSAASGSRFVAGASVTEAGHRRRGRRGSPSVGQRLGAVGGTGAATQQTAARRPARSAHAIDDRLGGGSDYAVFLNHLGVPSADLAFDGPDRMYHTALRHSRLRRPRRPIQGSVYTTTMARLMGVAAMRLSGADVVPIDPVAIASAIRSYRREIAEPSVPGERRASLRGVEAALDRLCACRAAPSPRGATRRCEPATSVISGPQPPAAAARAILRGRRRAARAEVVQARADGTGALLSAPCAAGACGSTRLG